MKLPLFKVIHMESETTRIPCFHSLVDDVDDDDSWIWEWLFHLLIHTHKTPRPTLKRWPDATVHVPCACAVCNICVFVFAEVVNAMQNGCKGNLTAMCVWEIIGHEWKFHSPRPINMFRYDNNTTTVGISKAISQTTDRKFLGMLLEM